MFFSVRVAEVVVSFHSSRKPKTISKSGTEPDSKTSQPDSVRLSSVPSCLGHSLFTLDGLTDGCMGTLAADGCSGH